MYQPSSISCVIYGLDQGHRVRDTQLCLARSAIVHTGTAIESRWGSSAAHPKTLDQFTLEVEEVMRRALLQAVEMAEAKPAGGALLDWDSRILPR
jgi:hypothetical protein